MSKSIRPKILITEAMPLITEEKKILSKYADVQVAKSTDEDNLIVEARDADIIMVVYARITERIINSATKLRGIVRYGIGVDNIDLKAASRRRIPVANVPDYCIGTVADHAFALLLALNRKLLLADNIVRTGNWGAWTSPSPKLMGVDLEGKTLGLIGIGKIGSAVAARAKGFGMKVIAYDPYIPKEVAERLGIELVNLETLLKNADFVSVHSPLTNETRGMIGERELKLMKKTAYIINTARGPIIQEEALYKALKNGWIAGAGLDVYTKEPPDRDNPLFKLENVVLTPHIAYYTQEAIWRLEMTAVEEAIRILQGQLPKNLVNKEAFT
ncbi:MAG: C-terminal binding protein [Candidatus Bathyarchaeia archaeon]